MLPLQSSSVATVQVFDYWGGCGLTTLAHAFGTKDNYTDLKCQQLFEHGLTIRQTGNHPPA